MAAKFKRMKTISAPTFDLKPDVTYFLQFDGERIPTRLPEKTDGKGNVTQPASDVNIVSVIDLESGEVGQLIMTDIFDSDLLKAFPDGLTGRAIEVTKRKVDGKRYFAYTTYALELESESETESEAKAKTKAKTEGKGGVE